MVTDIHFHMVGVECDEHMLISETMKNETFFSFYRDYLGLKMGVRSEFVSNSTALDYLLKTVDASKKVDRCVLLAFDWVYTDGKVDREQSHLWVSNDKVADVVKMRPDRLLFGASVNPNREDAIKELRRVKKMGAVLIKLVPSSQGIDLEDHEMFFKEMAELKLPLLCHCGVEHGIPCFGTGEEDIPDHENPKQKLNDTDKIKIALEAGVKVIAAHCALPIDEDDGLESYEKLRKLMSNPKYNNFLFADLSAFFIPFKGHRRGVVRQASEELDHTRLILGSDFPVLSVPLLSGYGWRMTLKEYLEILGEGNMLDRNALATTTDRLFDKCVLENANKVLGLFDGR